MDFEPAAEPSAPVSLDERVGRWLERSLGRERLTPGRAERDLRMLEIAPSAFMGAKVASALAGLVVAPSVAAFAALAGVGVSWRLPALGAVILAGAGFVIPDLDVHAKAERQRRAFRRSLSGFLDMVTLALAAGELISGALTKASQSGDGWVFALVRRTLRDAEQRGISPWDALGRAGEERGLDELCELAASVRLAGTDGAQIRKTLTAKAESLRARTLADMQADANEATTRMVLPLVGIAMGFLILVGYPAVSHILGSG
jgi:Flp pilus assembly protein TadB